MPLGPQDIDLMQSRNSLAAGGLPTRAKLRLKDEAAHKLFTSDLSVSELLLTKDVACEPISQVMGSSIYHIGMVADYKGSTGEMTRISDAHRDARRKALSRVWQEAQAVRADAVIGVRIQERPITVGAHGKGGDDGNQVIEFTVLGTAVRAPWITHAKGAPILTDLNGQDLWALARDGFEPCGFLFDFCRYHVWHVMQPGGWTRGGEVSSASTAVEAARAIVASRVHEQAVAFQAEFVVGSDIKVDVHEVPCGWPGCRLNDLDVNIALFGTAIRRIPGVARLAEANVPPLVLSMIPLGRKGSSMIVEDEEDETKEIEEQGKLQEERAAEADEGGDE